MNENFEQAYLRLQERALSQHDYARAEVYEAGLNILLRHPERDRDPRFLLWDAIGDAEKALARRRAIVDITPSDMVVEADTIATRLYATDLATVEIADFIARAPLGDRERNIFALLVDGETPASIARRLGLTAANVRNIIHRIRPRMRAYWRAAA